MLRPKEIEEKLNLAEKAAGYKFSDRSLLLEAITHRSYANESRKNSVIKDNDRLEFLGDAILDMVVAEKMYHEFPDLNSGEMTKFRADLVNEHALADMAKKDGLGEALLLGVGEERSGGATKASLLSDAYESLIAAVFIDGGIEPVKKLFMRHLKMEIKHISRHIGERDSKSVLQEWCAKRHWKLPKYKVIDCSGPDHRTEYTVCCIIGEREFCTDVGRSIKQAQQNVAGKTLEILEKEEKLQLAEKEGETDGI